MAHAAPLRAFIAIPLPEAVRALIGRTAQQLGQGLPRGSVRWVKPENSHLTLIFLGDEVAPDKIPPIIEAMTLATSALSPFQLHTTALGCFPNPRRPRVLWLGVGGDTAPLQQLKSRLDTTLAPLGWEPEKRPFSPHLTLGRVNNGRALATLTYSQPIPSEKIAVEAIHLYRSELTGQGARYTILHTASFSH